jgi:uncharacterized repeat protein (TIGR03803 family)
MVRSCASLLAILVMACSFATAQAKYKVLYSFGTNPNDGYNPNGGLVFDNAGNLYGTAQFGGSQCHSECGIVFELSPSSNGSWTENILYNFCSQSNCADGQFPQAGLVLDDSGNLYGTTESGGAHAGGTVFELSPPSAPGANWTETVLWSFGGANDGGTPFSKLTWDAAGNLYGTTSQSTAGKGTVFELTPGLNGWAEKVLYTFCVNYPDCSDGANPMAGVTFDKSGNLYGTTFDGGTFGDGKWGVVYELSPTSGGGWMETTIHLFSSTGGGESLSEVNFDNAGNLYGTVSQGGPHSPAQCGGVFKMTSTQAGWKEAIFPFNDSGIHGCRPQAGVFVDNKTGSVYGTAQVDASYEGIAYKISGTKETILHGFCQQPGCVDGSLPNSFLTPNAGKLYGTTAEGGTSSACGQLGCGVVFEISP